MMGKDWKDPLYVYRTKSRKLQIDVSLSAPNFKFQIRALEDVASQFRSNGIERVLDFGAGNLRNTLYLLEEGFQVWAVEFKEVFDRKLGGERLAAARKYKGFFFLEYPSAFLEFEDQLDAVLLINVVNVVPEPTERRKIMRECAKRLRRGGFLLLMTQYGEPNYRPNATKRAGVSDGYAYRLNQKRQTFNREFSYDQLKALMQKSYYRDPPQRVVAKNHRAFLAEKVR